MDLEITIRVKHEFDQSFNVKELISDIKRSFQTNTGYKPDYVEVREL